MSMKTEMKLVLGWVVVWCGAGRTFPSARRVECDGMGSSYVIYLAFSLQQTFIWSIPLQPFIYKIWPAKPFGYVCVCAWVLCSQISYILIHS